MMFITKDELIEQLERAKNFEILEPIFVDGVEVSIEDLAMGLFEGKFKLDLDGLAKACDKKEKFLKNELIYLGRRGGLSREELEDKIMQGIINGALGIRYAEISPYSHGYEVTFGGDNPGSVWGAKNRWECYCSLFEIPGKIVGKIEQDIQDNPWRGKCEPLNICEVLNAIDNAEKAKITSFTLEKDSGLEPNIDYRRRGHVATVMDVHAGLALDGITKHRFHGDYSSGTPVSQNDLVETLVYLKGFCLDCLFEENLIKPNGFNGQRCEEILKYLKEHGTDITTKKKLERWIKENPDKCGYEENRKISLDAKIKNAACRTGSDKEPEKSIEIER